MLERMTSHASTSSAQTSTLQVLGICGSLRKKSFNLSLLHAAQALQPDGMEISVIDLHEIPLFNQDVFEAGLPDGVKRFRERIAAADALLISSPEYNYSISGVMKNAIDWASRPPTLPLTEKPLGIMGATPGGLGTVRGQLALRQVCIFTNMVPMNKPELFVSDAGKKFDGDGKLADEDTKKKIKEFLAAFATFAGRLKQK